MSRTRNNADSSMLIPTSTALNSTMYILGVTGTGSSQVPYVSTSFYFNASTNNFTTSGSITASGTITGSKVYNAVFNDIADFFEIDNELEIIEYGKCYVRYSNGDTNISNKYNQKGIVGIASDTFGYGLGRKDIGNKEIPIAVAGIVLAYVDQEYESGTPLTCSTDGFLTKINRLQAIIYPERIVGTFYKKESLENWNGIEVNNRHWVKVK